MYITENYACFHAAIPTTNISFALENIKSLKRYSPLFLLPTGIEINLVDGTKVCSVVLNARVDRFRAQYYFQSFVHREEAFAVLNYLWKNSPFYIDIPPELNATTLTESTHAPAKTTAAVESSSTSTATSSRVNSGEKNQPQQPQHQLMHYDVDTERSKNVVRLLEETQRIGAATSQQLHQQGCRLLYSIAFVDSWCRRTAKKC
jgi:hypothetical protein